MKAQLLRANITNLDSESLVLVCSKLDVVDHASVLLASKLLNRAVTAPPVWEHINLTDLPHTRSLALLDSLVAKCSVLLSVHFGPSTREFRDQALYWDFLRRLTFFTKLSSLSFGAPVDAQSYLHSDELLRTVSMLPGLSMLSAPLHVRQSAFPTLMSQIPFLQTPWLAVSDCIMGDAPALHLACGLKHLWLQKSVGQLAPLSDILALPIRFQLRSLHYVQGKHDICAEKLACLIAESKNLRTLNVSSNGAFFNTKFHSNTMAAAFRVSKIRNLTVSNVLFSTLKQTWFLLTLRGLCGNKYIRELNLSNLTWQTGLVDNSHLALEVAAILKSTRLRVLNITGNLFGTWTSLVVNELPASRLEILRMSGQGGQEVDLFSTCLQCKTLELVEMDNAQGVRVERRLVQGVEVNEVVVVE